MHICVLQNVELAIVTPKASFKMVVYVQSPNIESHYIENACRCKQPESSLC